MITASIGTGESRRFFTMDAAREWLYACEKALGLNVWPVKIKKSSQSR